MGDKLQGVSVMVPVYRAAKIVKQCLDRLDENYRGVPVLLVDDCSEDQETDAVLTEFVAQVPEKRSIYRREKRGWFTRASNSGLDMASRRLGVDWVLALNSDCIVGAGAIEEMLDVWEIGEKEGHRVGLVGSEGPQPSGHPRYAYRWEREGKAYVTGHAFLFSVRSLLEGLRFPHADGEVAGFSAFDLVHINSDRALCWKLNREGYATMASFHSAIGHVGGGSWGYNLANVYGASQDVVRREP